MRSTRSRSTHFGMFSSSRFAALALASACAVAIAQPAAASDPIVGIITTIGGNGTAGYLGDGAAATAARVNMPNGVAVDAAGNVYVADTNNHRIRKITPGGVITTFAGNGTAGFLGDGGPATSARIFSPQGVAVDAAGNVYIADYANNRIREVFAATGNIATVAGSGTGTFGGDGGLATAAQLQLPTAVAVDGAGNLFIADTFNHRIRKVTASTGIITTLAGSGTAGYDGDGALATAAKLQYPQGVAVDGAGNVYLGDTNNYRVRRVSAATGIITTVAGTGSAGFDGEAGPGTSARLYLPTGVATDAAGNLFIVDQINERIRKLAVGTGIITTVAGSGNNTFGGDGGQAPAGQLNTPEGVAVDAAGNLYIADTNNQRIRKVSSPTPTYLMTTIAGTGLPGFDGDGAAAIAAKLQYPQGIAVDGAGNVYIADTNNNRIRRIAAGTGVITTFAGTGVAGFSGEAGPAAAARLFDPAGLAVDSAGNLYIADQFNQRIRKVSAATGVITTIAGNGTAGFSGDGALATTAQVSSPNGVSVDPSGNVYIADQFNHRIRKVTAGTGIITTIAGDGTASYLGDGGAATAARLNTPSGVAADAFGNVYIADSNNNRIRKVAGGVITTVAGNGTGGFGGENGPATSANISNPQGLAVDSGGNVYIADWGNDRIRKLTIATGALTTVAGSGDRGFGGDGWAAAAAQLNLPTAVALDGSGNLYIADTYNHRARKAIKPLDVPTGLTATASGTTGIRLNWIAPAGATSFNVKRSTSSSTETTIASGVAGTTYLDSAVVIGQTYYYVVTANYPAGESANSNEASFTLVSVVGDFDGDGKADVTVYRPGNGTWYVLQSGAGYGNAMAVSWGSSMDLPEPGDYDGDGKTDIAIYRPGNGTWYILKSSTNFTAAIAIPWGLSTDVPVPGDYDGDGRTDIAVYRPGNGTWYILQSSTNFTSAVAYVWGNSTDLPVPGDYDGDRRTDIAVYRPSNGTWYILQSTTSFTAAVAFVWGSSTDITVAADYDGDGRTDVAIYRPGNGTWYILQSSTNFTSAIAVVWGAAGDVPVPADFDGDARADIAVYRPGNGTWYILKSGTNFTAAISFQWGGAGDVPVLRKQ